MSSDVQSSGCCVMFLYYFYSWHKPGNSYIIMTMLKVYIKKSILLKLTSKLLAVCDFRYRQYILESLKFYKNFNILTKYTDFFLMQHNGYTLKHPIVYFSNIIKIICNHIGGVMVSVIASSAVDRGFEPWSGEIKDYKIGISFFFAKHAAKT